MPSQNLIKLAFLCLVSLIVSTWTLQAQVSRSGGQSLSSGTVTHDDLSSAQSSTGPLIFLPAVGYSLPTLDFGWGVAVGDVNGDGKPDLVVTDYDYYAPGVSVFLGNGDGTFQAPVTYPTSSPIFSVAIADVNGDQKPDLLLVSGFEVGVMLNNGDGTFQPAVFYSSGATYNLQFNSELIAVADVNADGKPDLLVANGYPGVGVLLGNGDGTFQPVVTYTLGKEQSDSIAVADVNGDGKPDLVLGGWNIEGIGLVAVMLGNGDGTFQKAVTHPADGYALGVAVADLNGDGKPDIAVATEYPGVGILLGNGDGTFQPVVRYNTGGTYSHFPYTQSVAIADVNQDGRPDLLVANYQPDKMGVLLGNGDGTFQSPVTYDVGPALGPTCVVAADVNADGKPDVIVTDESIVAVFLNNNGAPSTNITLAANPNPVTIREAVTYTATITSQSGASLGGTVTFKDNGTVSAVIAVSDNQASYSATYLPPQVGYHSITAAYSGVLDESAGSRSQTLKENVRTTSITTLTTSGSPSTAGQPVTFTATVNSRYGTIPDGELVEFYLDSNTLLGSVPLSGGQAAYTTSALKIGTNFIKAVYVGDKQFAPSNAHIEQVVQ